MGFNFGAALGGAAEGASDTYFKIKKQQREDAEMQQRKEIHDAWKKEQLENEQLKALAGETLGRSDTPEAWRTAGGAIGPAQPTSAQNTLANDEYYRNMGGRQSQAVEENLGVALPKGNAAEMFPAQKMYGRDQAMKDFTTRAMGINPMKAMDYESKGLQNQSSRQAIEKGGYDIKALQRSAKQDEAFDTHMEETHKNLAGLRQTIQGTFDTDGMNGLVKKYSSEFKDATGNSVALVGNALVIKDSKGKVVGQPVTRPEDAVNALSNVIGKKQMESSLDAMVTKGMFRNSTEMMDYFTKRSTMRTQEATAAAATSNAQASMITAGAASQNAATHALIAPSTIAQNQAQAAMFAAHAGVYTQTLEVAKTNKEAREAMQPFIDQINALNDPSGKDKPEFDRLSMKAMAAGAAKSADIKGLLEASKRADKSVAPEVDPEAKKAAYKELSEVGTDPKAIAAVKAKWSNVFGPSALDKAIAAKVKPPAEQPAAPAAAIPATNVAPAAPASALPNNVPIPTKTYANGISGYQVKGVIGVFKSPEEAQAAWAQKYAPKAPGMFD